MARKLPLCPGCPPRRLPLLARGARGGVPGPSLEGGLEELREFR